MNILGTTSKTTFLAIEEEKLSIQFAASTTIKPGQPLKLDAAGTVSVWTKADLRIKLIGYAYNGGASGDMITAFVRGYVLVFGIATAATVAGPVVDQGYDSSTAISGVTGYNSFALAVSAEEANGWQLDQSTGAGQLVRVLLAD